MALYKISDNKLERIKEYPFRLEKDIQNLTEHSLREVFNLEFVKSEFTLNNFRIDTLCFDEQAKSFVIIEYKRDKNFSIVDQGYAYLALMLNNKADFILEYNEAKSNSLKRNDIDWTQSRVLFISPTFTTYQKEAINFRDLPIELWEIKRYQNETVLYERIRTSGSPESITTISSKENDINKVSNEIKVYTEEDHLQNASDVAKELYSTLKSSILNLGEVEIKPKKMEIGFYSGNYIADVALQKSGIKLWVNLKRGELDDPKGLTRDVSSKGHWGNGDYEIKMYDDENLEYIMSLIKQSYKKHNG